MNGVRTDIHKHMCANQRQVKFSEDRTITEFMAVILVFYFIEYHVHCFLHVLRLTEVAATMTMPR